MRPPVRPSPISDQEKICERFQCGCATPKNLQRLKSARREFLGQTARLFHPDDRWVGRFLGGGILAGGLAKLFGGLSEIENVVYDLKCQADVVAKTREGLELRRRSIGAHAPQTRRTTKQRRCLPFVNIF